MRKLRVLVLVHPDLVPPETLAGLSVEQAHAVKTEFNVVRTLRKLGHDVRPLGVQYELQPIRAAVEEWRPHIVFNLLEEFHSVSEFDQHVVSYLELLQVPHTGCNPRGMTITRDKALSKKIAAYHRIHVPRFATFPRRRRRRRPAGLAFPLIVKEPDRRGVARHPQASVVYDDDELRERVTFIHSRTAATPSPTVHRGREKQLGVGNERVTVLPIWELLFENLSPRALPIATARVKHDPRYQEARGIYQAEATDLPDEIRDRVVRTTRRLYRLMHLTGYARIDYRLRDDGTLFFLEANPNPEIAPEEEFASAAEAAGIPYPQLLQKILNLGLRASRW